MRFLVQWIRGAVESRLRVPADYLTTLGEATFAGFLKFVLFLPLSGHRGDTAAEWLHAARLVAFQHEDCGTCLQAAIHVALDEGVSPQAIAAVLDRDFAKMTVPVSLAVRFSEGLAAMDGSEQAAREEIRGRLGDAVLADLSLAIASARVFPTLKRGLGHGASCSVARPVIQAVRDR